MDKKTIAVKKALFVEGFSETGVIGTGCRRADISRYTHKIWAESDPEFLADCQDAYQTSIDLAEEELRARSVGGVEEVLMHKGEPVWKRDPKTGSKAVDEEGNLIPFTINKKSDRLLEVYIKAHKPGYREPKGGVVVHTNAVPMAIEDYVESDEGETGINITYILPDGKQVSDYQEGAQAKLAPPDAVVPVEIDDEEWDDMFA